MLALISAGKKRSYARELPEQAIRVFRIHEIRHAALATFRAQPADSATSRLIRTTGTGHSICVSQSFDRNV